MTDATEKTDDRDDDLRPKNAVEAREEIVRTAAMLRRYADDIFPAGADGNLHFGRVMMESAAKAIDDALAFGIAADASSARGDASGLEDEKPVLDRIAGMVLGFLPPDRAEGIDPHIPLGDLGFSFNEMEDLLNAVETEFAAQILTGHGEKNLDMTPADIAAEVEEHRRKKRWGEQAGLSPLEFMVRCMQMSAFVTTASVDVAEEGDDGKGLGRMAPRDVARFCALVRLRLDRIEARAGGRP